MSALPGTSLLRPADWAPAQLAGVRAHPQQRGPPSSQRPPFSGPPRSSPRRREASAARPQMSLPLRLPYCYPERRWRGALWLACICARVTTPRPRLPRLLVAAGAGARRRRRGGLLGGGGLCSGRKLQEARLERRQGRHPPRPGLVLRSPRSSRPRPSPAGAPGGPSALRVIPARLGSRRPPLRTPEESRTSRQPCAPEQPRLEERSLNSVQITGGAWRRRCRRSGLSKCSPTEGVAVRGARRAEKGGGVASCPEPLLENLRETAAKLPCGRIRRGDAQYLHQRTLRK